MPLLAADQGREPLILDILGKLREQGAGRLYGTHRLHSGVHLGYLLHNDAQRNVIDMLSAVFLRYIKVIPTQRDYHLIDIMQVFMKLLRLHFGARQRPGSELLQSKLPYLFPEHLLFRSKAES